MCCGRELIGTYQNVPSDRTSCHFDGLCTEGGRGFLDGIAGSLLLCATMKHPSVSDRICLCLFPYQGMAYKGFDIQVISFLLSDGLD